MSSVAGVFRISTRERAFSMDDALSFVKKAREYVEINTYPAAAVLSTLKLLEAGCRLNITCLAYEAGFSDLSLFNRQFKSYWGRSPREMARLFRRTLAGDDLPDLDQETPSISLPSHPMLVPVITGWCFRAWRPLTGQRRGWSRPRAGGCGTASGDGSWWRCHRSSSCSPSLLRTPGARSRGSSPTEARTSSG